MFNDVGLTCSFHIWVSSENRVPQNVTGIMCLRYLKIVIWWYIGILVSLHGCMWQFGYDKHVFQLWVHIIGMNRGDLKCLRKVAATESPLSGEDLAVSAIGRIAISRKRSRARGSALVGDTQVQGEIKLWQAKVQTNQVLYGTFPVMQRTVRNTNDAKLGAVTSCSLWINSQKMPEAPTSILYSSQWESAGSD